jgi:hypothetical protein
MQRLLALATAVPEKSDAHAAPTPPWLARVGTAAGRLGGNPIGDPVPG